MAIIHITASEFLDGTFNNWSNVETGYYDARNDTADHFIIDFTQLVPGSTFGSLWFNGDSAYNGDTDPATFDTFEFLLAPGWELRYISFYGGTLENPGPGDHGTYFGLYYNGVRQSQNVWITSTADTISICFVRGSKLQCADGTMQTVEDLRAGDVLMTRGGGPQEIIWIGSSKVSSDTLVQFPERRPVKFDVGAIGNAEAISVSPQHRMLVEKDGKEYLAAAKHFVNGRNVTVDDSCTPVEYFHVLFKKHEIVNCQGAWCESFYPGPFALRNMDTQMRDEVSYFLPKPDFEKGVEVTYGPLGSGPIDFVGAA